MNRQKKKTRSFPKPCGRCHRKSVRTWGRRPFHCPDCFQVRRKDANKLNWRSYGSVAQAKADNRKPCKNCFPLFQDTLLEKCAYDRCGSSFQPRSVANLAKDLLKSWKALPFLSEERYFGSTTIKE